MSTNTNNFSVEKKDADNTTTIKLSGCIDEDSRINQLFEGTLDNVIVDLNEITMINSVGIREWVNSIEAAQATKKITLLKIATSVVAQINMVANFTANSEIISFFAPYYCDECQEEQDFLLEYDKDFPDKKNPVAPVFQCATCKNDLEFDDVEERYFNFIKRSA